MRKYWVELAADYGGWHEAESHEEAAEQVFGWAYGGAGCRMIDQAGDESGSVFARDESLLGFHNWSVFDDNDELVDDIFVWNEEELEAREARFRESLKRAGVFYRA